MKKSEFMKKLKSGLRFQLPRSEFKAVLKQYDKFFEENKHRPEEEVVAECGNIEMIISENLGGRKAVSNVNLRIFALFVLSIIYYLFIFWDHYWDHYNLFITNFAFIYLYFLAIILVIGRERVFSKDIKIKNLNKIYIVNFLVLILVAVALYFMTLEINTSIEIVYTGEMNFRLESSNPNFGLYEYEIFSQYILIFLNILCFLVSLSSLIYGRSLFLLFFLNSFFGNLFARFSWQTYWEILLGGEEPPFSSTYVNEQIINITLKNVGKFLLYYSCLCVAIFITVKFKDIGFRKKEVIE